jgi:hypothetical protein
MFLLLRTTLAKTPIEREGRRRVAIRLGDISTNVKIDNNLTSVENISWGI